MPMVIAAALPGSSDALAGQATGAAGHRPGMAALHRAHRRTQLSVAAVHEHPFAMALLVAQAQAQLEVMLGAAGDLITADRPDAQTWSGHRRIAPATAQNQRERPSQHQPEHTDPVQPASSNGRSFSSSTSGSWGWK